MGWHSGEQDKPAQDQPLQLKAYELSASYMSSVTTKTCNPTEIAAQPQSMARGLKFQIMEVEGLYNLCSKNKGADQQVFSCSYRIAKCFIL